MTNEELEASYREADLRNCRKHKHQLVWPVFESRFGGVIAWRCACGFVTEHKTTP